MFFSQAADKCFSHTIAEANRDDRCVLAASDLESKAWDRNGVSQSKNEDIDALATS